jgi:hypothetical protein
MEMLAAGLWVACAYLAARVANARGQSGAWYAVIGLVFGPLGVAFALVSQIRADVLEAREMASGRMQRCPYCAELARQAAVRCRHCLEDLTPSSRRTP